MPRSRNSTKGAQALLQPHALAGFDEVLAAYAAKFGVVPDQVGELAALLHEVAGREARDLLLEVGHPEQLAQLEARVVEAQRLIEIRSEEEMFRRSCLHKLLQSACPSFRATNRDAVQVNSRNAAKRRRWSQRKR